MKVQSTFASVLAPRLRKIFRETARKAPLLYYLVFHAPSYYDNSRITNLKFVYGWIP